MWLTSSSAIDLRGSRGHTKTISHRKTMSEITPLHTKQSIYHWRRRVGKLGGEQWRASPAYASDCDQLLSPLAWVSASLQLRLARCDLQSMIRWLIPLLRCTQKTIHHRNRYSKRVQCILYDNWMCWNGSVKWTVPNCSWEDATSGNPDKEMWLTRQNISLECTYGSEPNQLTLNRYALQ